MNRRTLSGRSKVASRQKSRDVVAAAESPRALFFSRIPAAWRYWLGAVIVPLAFAAQRIGLDLFFDEAYTLKRYVSTSPLEIVTSYPDPNNHVFYSLLLYPFHGLWSDPMIARLVALLITAATLAVMFALGRRWIGDAAGLLATCLLGLNQMFLIHGMQVRGYGLSMLLFEVLMLALTPSSETSWRPKRAAWIAIAGAAFLWTLPTNALFFVPLATLAVVETGRRQGWKAAGRESFGWIAAVALAAICYSPIWRDVRAVAGSHPATWREVGDLALVWLAAATRDFWPLLAISPLGIWTWMRTGRENRANPAPLVFSLAMILLAFLESATLAVRPFPRNFTPLLIPLSLGLACALTPLAEALRVRFAPRAAPITAAIFALPVTLMVLVPPLVTYADRLADHRRQRKAEDGYWVDSAARFEPSQVVDFLAHRIDFRRDYWIVMSPADQSQLGSYLEIAHLPYRRTTANPSLSRVYLVMSPGTDFDELGEVGGLDETALRALPIVAEFGSFEVRESTAPLRLRASTDQTD